MRIIVYVIGGLGLLWWLVLLAGSILWCFQFGAKSDPRSLTAAVAVSAAGALFSYGLIHWCRRTEHGLAVFFAACIFLAVTVLVSVAVYMIPGLFMLTDQVLRTF